MLGTRRSGQVATADGSAQHLPHPPHQVFRRERLVEEAGIRAVNAPPQHLVVGVARDIEHLEVGPAAPSAARPAPRRPSPASPRRSPADRWAARSARPSSARPGRAGPRAPRARARPESAAPARARRPRPRPPARSRCPRSASAARRRALPRARPSGRYTFTVVPCSGSLETRTTPPFCRTMP